MTPTPTAPPTPALLLDTVNACRALSISQSTLRKAVAAGELRPTRIGSALRFSVRELERWIAAKTETAPAETTVRIA